MVTVAMLIARNQPGDLKHYMDIALDNGVTPAELSEIITHLAFYSGWPNAMSAVSVTKAVFETRGVTADALPDASPDLLPLNQQAEKQRSETVEKMLAQYLQAWLNLLLTPVPGSLAKTRAETPRQKPDYGQRLNRIRTERADWLSPQ